jgi:hypothetical protein
LCTASFDADGIYTVAQAVANGQSSTPALKGATEKAQFQSNHRLRCM